LYQTTARNVLCTFFLNQERGMFKLRPAGFSLDSTPSTEGSLGAGLGLPSISLEQPPQAHSISLAEREQCDRSVSSSSIASCPHHVVNHSVAPLEPTDDEDDDSESTVVETSVTFSTVPSSPKQSSALPCSDRVHFKVTETVTKRTASDRGGVSSFFENPFLRRRNRGERTGVSSPAVQLLAPLLSGMRQSGGGRSHHRSDAPEQAAIVELTDSPIQTRPQNVRPLEQLLPRPSTRTSSSETAASSAVSSFSTSSSPSSASSSSRLAIENPEQGLIASNGDGKQKASEPENQQSDAEQLSNRPEITEQQLLEYEAQLSKSDLRSGLNETDRELFEVCRTFEQRYKTMNHDADQLIIQIRAAQVKQALQTAELLCLYQPDLLNNLVDDLQSRCPPEILRDRDTARVEQ